MTSAPGRATDLGAMPPPPPPVPTSKDATLECEANALSSCFKNAVVKTGQIYAFHADARRLGIHKCAPHPPRSLTDSLGRALERYDQICDAIESQLLRAISVLKRDLTREERRAREAEQATIAAQASKFPVPDVATQPSSTPGLGSPQGAVQIPNRRQSAISLLSLNRNALPPKLDLSSSSMRISAEEVALFPKGLVPSPVSLAPKSARLSATADIDFMAAFASAAGNQHIDIDLTVSDSPPTMMTAIDPSLGSSADKPIELDLDAIDVEMSDVTNLFGDAPESITREGQTTVESLFSPTATDSGARVSSNEVPQGQKESAVNDHLDMDILGALHAEHDSQGENLFDPVASGSSGENQQPQSGSGVPPPPPLVPGFTQSGMQSGVGGFDFALDLDPSWQSMSLTDISVLLDMSSSGSNQDAQKPGP